MKKKTSEPIKKVGELDTKKASPKVGITASKKGRLKVGEIPKVQIKHVIFDTETTGLIDNRTVKLDLLPEIIEVYATSIDLDTGEVIDTVHSLIKPRKPLIEKTTTITGITEEMLASSPTFPEIADELINLLENADFIIAHNARFDCDMVEVELERIGRKIKWPQVLCTIEQSMHYQGRRLTLTLLYEYLFPGEKFEAHRADSDVSALTRICVEMRRRGDL